MAADGRTADGSLAKAQPILRQLFERGSVFDFYQAVRLLDRLAWGTSSLPPVPENSNDHSAWIAALEKHLSARVVVPPGRGPLAARRNLLNSGYPVKFRSSLNWDFPGHDVLKITAPCPTDAPRDPRERRPIAEMEVSFLSLGGASGPLPEPYVDRIIEQTLKRDFAGRDFLDIFHHRLLALLYEGRKGYSVALQNDGPFNSPIAQALFALAGVDFRPGPERDRLPQRSSFVPYYAGLFSIQSRPSEGLERMLSDYFSVPVRIQPHLGRRQLLEPGDETRIGAARGKNNRLGWDSNLGTQYWDLQGMFGLQLGPLSRAQYEPLLPVPGPGGRNSPQGGFNTLVEMTKFYVGIDLEFEIEFRLSLASIPPLRLPGARRRIPPRCERRPNELAWDNPGRLGWTTFLGRNSSRQAVSTNIDKLAQIFAEVFNAKYNMRFQRRPSRLELYSRRFRAAKRTGRILGPDNKGVPNAVIRFLGPAQTVPARRVEFRADNSGIFFFRQLSVTKTVPDALTVGDWQFSVTAPYWEPWRGTISLRQEVPLPERAIIEIALNDSPGVHVCRDDNKTTEAFVEEILRRCPQPERVRDWAARFGHLVAGSPASQRQRFVNVTEAIQTHGNEFLELVESRLPKVRIFQYPLRVGNGQRKQ